MGEEFPNSFIHVLRVRRENEEKKMNTSCRKDEYKSEYGDEDYDNYKEKEDFCSFPNSI